MSTGVDHHAVDHRAVVGSLPTELRKRLLQRTNLPGAIRLGTHVGGIIGLGAVIALDPPFVPVLWVVQGILLVFLFSLLHECSHLTAFRTVWVNNVTAAVCGFLLFLPATHFRYYHFAHHRFTNIPGRDPELEMAKPETLLGYIVYISGWPALARQLVVLGRNALGRNREEFVIPAIMQPVQIEAIVSIVGYLVCAGVSLIIGTTLLLEVWLLPLLLGQPFLRLYLLAEHGRCPLVANMLDNTRTTFTTAVVRWLAWNMPYHTAHHCIPSVPFHQLPELHQHIEDHVRQTERGYVRFHGKYLDGIVRHEVRA